MPAGSTTGSTADVIVVGAGPGGSATAAHLAQAGVDVLVLEKTAFPREKVCGDGLTPRATRALLRIGIDLDGPGWIRNQGLRVLAGGHRLELPWPALADYPAYGLVRTREDFDEILARHAQKAGARLMERTAVTGPMLDDSGRVVGVTARTVDEHGRKTGDEQRLSAQVVVAADGNSARLPLSLGLQRRLDRPMGVAVRTYFDSPRHDDDWLESHLELWDGPWDAEGSKMLPGYGWIFGVGDGTCNVGVGILDTSAAFQHVDYKDLLQRWLDQTPEEWGFREQHRTRPIRGAALPMAFNRKPHYARGLLLVGDAGGMVNPMNGEGIAYALESGELAAETITQALGRPNADRERVLRAYPEALAARYGGYFTLGRGFVKLIGRPRFIRAVTRHGIKRPALMRIALKLLANLTDPRAGDATDRTINALNRITPAA
ncbi:MAG: geranylgeranyl reductase family protein [Actinomycetota bacterium]|nr:geranylgeranyl reductase family protein [Actinomycetota bacterium]